MGINKTQIDLRKAIGNVLKQNPGCWQDRLNQMNEQAKIIQALKKELPEGWVPLRIAVSCYLTQGAKVDNLIFPKTKKDWINVWHEIKPKPGETKAQLTKRFKVWLRDRGNYHYAEKFAGYYAEYWDERDFDTKKSLKDLQKLEQAKDEAEIVKFWRNVNSKRGIGVQYAKNIPMDEKHKHFKDCIKVDSRLKNILKGTAAEHLSDKEKEDQYLAAGKANKLNGWETDRFCFYFHNQIKQAIKS
jgi:hypothetical protein